MADAREAEEAHQNDGQEAEDELERIEQQAQTLSGSCTNVLREIVPEHRGEFLIVLAGGDAPRAVRRRY